MDPTGLKKRLRSSLFGTNLFYFEELNSTNTKAMELARKGAPEGTVVITDFQTKGKGRLNRSWYAEKGKNILLSMILRPEQDVEATQKITLAAAHILIKAIESFIDSDKNAQKRLKINVKWPNDIFFNGKKGAGILAESILKERKIDALVMGFGINLNMRKQEIPESIRDTATSLYEEIGKEIDRETFLAEFLNEFEEQYCKLERTNYESVVYEWKQYCDQFGQEIDITGPEGKKRVYFHDVNAEGHLLYRLNDGSVEELVAGDITKV